MGGIIYWHGEVDGARADYEAALAIWREVGDRREIANAAYNLSFVFTMGILEEPPPDAREQAAALLDEALAIYRSLGDVPGEANVHWGIGIQHYFAQRRRRRGAGVRVRRSRCIARSATGRRRRGRCTSSGLALLKLGDIDVAAAAARRGPRRCSTRPATWPA